MAPLINYPIWVTDATSVPGPVLVKAKELVYTFVAGEKLRVLFNAGWKWVRSESLDADEQALLAAEFPSQWPTSPTAAQMQSYVDATLQPRDDAVQKTRATHRKGIPPTYFSYVNLGDLI